MNNELNEATAVAGMGMFSELMPMARNALFSSRSRVSTRRRYV